MWMDWDGGRGVPPPSVADWGGVLLFFANLLSLNYPSLPVCDVQGNNEQLRRDLAMSPSSFMRVVRSMTHCFIPSK